MSRTSNNSAERSSTTSDSWFSPTLLTLGTVLLLVTPTGCKGDNNKDCRGTACDDNGATPCEEHTDCDDENLCNGDETCGGDNTCQNGIAPEGPTPCGTYMMCFAGDCVAAVCGDDNLDPGEHCDDGNTAPYDGCDDTCRFELFMRAYKMELQKSPAASFCDRPTSALGDSLLDFALQSNNATRQASINNGLENMIFYIAGLDDPSGQTNETIEIHRGYSDLDLSAGTWPTDGSNPIDWSFIMQADSVDAEGRFGDRIQNIPLVGGAFSGGPGTSTRPLPDFINATFRGRLDPETTADVPASAPDPLAPGLTVAQELVADGPDEGICGALTVGWMASIPIDEGLAECLECEGQSHTYTPCESGVVDETCNSSLEPLVGGCIIGPSCEAGAVVITPTLPDVDNGGPALVLDTNNLNKLPASQTDNNLDGYTVYFKTRARRVRVTGTE